MKRVISATVMAAALLACVLSSVAETPSKPKYNEWWNQSYLTKPFNSPNSKKLPLISVKGNRFVDPQGKAVLFRGVNIADPDKLENQGHWNKEFFVKVKETGATLVRIPVHPVAWRERGPKAYLALLDQAVEWCTELGMYVDVDWHSIGNLKAGLFQDPMYETGLPETFQFWRTIAAHYAGNNTVAFYELFNEPTLYRGQLGAMSWDEWKKINEDMITVIRAFDTETVPLVAGLDWAYDLTPLLINPVSAEGIGYVTHPYPHKRSKPWEPKWEENFGFAAGQYPIIATEIGFTMGKEGMAENGEYGNAIVNYLEAKNISWLAWVYDAQWTPTMIRSFDTFELTESGKFFVDVMHRKAAAPVPATGK